MAHHHTTASFCAGFKRILWEKGEEVERKMPERKKEKQKKGMLSSFFGEYCGAVS